MNDRQGCLDTNICISHIMVCMRSNSTIQIRVFSVVKIQKKVEGRESRSRNQKVEK